MDAFEQELLQILVDNPTADLRAYAQSKSKSVPGEELIFLWILKEMHDKGYIKSNNIDDLFDGKARVMAQITGLGRNRLIGYLNGFDGEYYHRERLIKNKINADTALEKQAIPTIVNINEPKVKQMVSPWRNILNKIGDNIIYIIVTIFAGLIIWYLTTKWGYLIN